MKIVLSRDVAIDGRHHSAGETVDVSNSDGIALVNMGKAQSPGQFSHSQFLQGMADPQ